MYVVYKKDKGKKGLKTRKNTKTPIKTHILRGFMVLVFGRKRGQLLMKF